MMVKKQTVWLLTMLTLMVVLSAYYLFYGDVEQIEVTQKTPADSQEGAVGEVENADADPFAKEPAPKEPAPKEPGVKEPAPKEPGAKEPAPKAPAVKEPAVKEPAPKEPAPEKKGTKENPAQKGSAPGSDAEIQYRPSTSTEDYFAELRLERQREREQMLEHYQQITLTSDNKDAVAEATAKMNEIESLESNEMLVENLIKSEGFPDAVVWKHDNKVNVFVQSEQLAREEVVAIINHVTKNLNVPGVNVTVTARQ